MNAPIPDLPHHAFSTRCGCSKCRARRVHARLDAELEALERGVSTPVIPSCDPVRHVFRRLNVVRWRNRYRPCRRAIPSSLDLAILSRARTRIPLRKVQWLINAAKAATTDNAHWVKRLPRSHIDSLADLTIELFIQQKPGMTTNEIQRSLASYLTWRHGNELDATCDRGFFVHYIQTGDAAGKLDIEKRFGLISFGLDLDTLYSRGGTLQIRPDGVLTDRDGYPVLGPDNKPVRPGLDGKE
ncbi:MAG: hypothetical protein JJ992_06315, partial [Planctomycetes bacterium]|nr:hypothetical protein [Planctomycetota bacterium]